MHRLGPPRALVAILLTGLVVASGACTREYRSDYGKLKLEQPPRPALTGTVGTPVTYDGIEFDLLDIKPFDQSPEAVPRLALTIRSDNASAAWSRNPNVALHCDESTEAGDWHQGSTWESGGLLPTGEVREGRLLVGFPKKSAASEYNVASCTRPRIVVTMSGDDQPQIVNYAVDDAVVRAAVNRPRGRALPLPPSAP